MSGLWRCGVSAASPSDEENWTESKGKEETRALNVNRKPQKSRQILDWEGPEVEDKGIAAQILTH